MSFADRVIAIITIIAEAAGEPFEGQVAVAATFFNRLKAKKFGSTIAQVCLQRYQYSEWNDDRGNNGCLLRAVGLGEAAPEFQSASKAYMDAFSGADPTNGATHYYNPKGVVETPEWALKGVFTKKIGNHLFYKDVP